MESTKVYEQWQATQGDPDDKFHWVYKCWKCVLEQRPELLNEGSARAFILNNQRVHQGRKRRAEQHKKANQEVVTEFPLITSSRERRVLTRAVLEEDLMGPIFKYLVAKSQQRDEACSLLDSYNDKLHQMRNATDAGRVLEIRGELALVEEKDLFHAEQQMSFQGWPEEQQSRFLRAVDYCDTLTELKVGDKIVGYIAACYICAAGRSGNECLALIRSPDFCTMYDDLVQYCGQRWYCRCCLARYQTKFGMLLKICKQDQYVYARIPVKNFDLLDATAMSIEETADPAALRSPEASFASLKRQTPSCGDHLRPAVATDMWKDPTNTMEGVYKISRDWFAALPSWRWEDIFVYSSHQPVSFTSEFKDMARGI